MVMRPFSWGSHWSWQFCMHLSAFVNHFACLVGSVLAVFAFLQMFCIEAGKRWSLGFSHSLYLHFSHGRRSQGMFGSTTPRGLPACPYENEIQPALPGRKCCQYHVTNAVLWYPSYITTHCRKTQVLPIYTSIDRTFVYIHIQSYTFVDQIVATSSDSADFGLFKKSPSLGKGGVGRWCRIQRSAWSAVFNWSPGEFRLRSLRQNCWLGFGCKTGPAAQKVDISIFS